jgi:hypothetical protein
MAWFKIRAFEIGAFKIGAGTLVVAAGLAATPLAALTMQECSAAYKAAKSGGTLGGMTWQDFRKAKCGPGTPAPGGSTEAKPGAQGKSGFLPGAVFPRAIAPQYGKESPGKARMLTCLDQYRRNKAGNANGGLKWTQKGGGYYSECNSRLKQ